MRDVFETAGALLLIAGIILLSLSVWRALFDFGGCLLGRLT